MAFTGDDDGVTRLQLRQYPADGFFSRSLDPDVFPLARTAQGIGDDVGGVFCARVIVGDDGGIGVVLCRLRHQRAFAMVAVAAAAKDAPQFAGNVRTDALQDIDQCCRGVGVIDDGGSAVRQADAFGAARNAVQGSEDSGNIGERGVEGEQAGGGIQEVINVESCQQVRADGGAMAGNRVVISLGVFVLQGEMDAVGVKRDITGADGRGSARVVVARAADGDDARRGVDKVVVKQAAAMRVVNIDNGTRQRAGKETGFGLEVVFEVAVVVEVVAAEVGEDANGKIHPGDAVLGEGV